MSPKKAKESQQRAAELAVPRQEAGERIQQRIAAAPSPTGLSQDQVDNWDNYNIEMLRRLFTTDQFAQEYQWATPVGGVIFGQESALGRVQRLLKHVEKRLATLESIKNRLELIPETRGALSSAPEQKALVDTRKVFLVHGHDEAVREAVARFLEKLELEPVILHEQATKGLTLIEKLEHYGDVGFAVILLTPDDVGAAKDSAANLTFRARQNVILELGYFLARLTRPRVCPLYKKPLELPSDYAGVGYVEIDTGGAWRLELARELKQAGFAVDLNNAI